MQYILAVPAARYGEFAADLKKLHAGQDNTQEWCGQTQWNGSRLVVAHDPVAGARRGAARDKTIAELLDLGQQCSVKLDEGKKSYLELLDGKLLLVTNTDEAPADVVQRYKSLADIERGFRVLKSDIADLGSCQIGPVYHRLPQRIRAHALICFMALLLYRVMRMRLKAAKRSESPTALLEQLKRIHQQTAVTADGKTLCGLTQITAQQKSLFAALELSLPTPSDLEKPVL